MLVKSSVRIVAVVSLVVASISNPVLSTATASTKYPAQFNWQAAISIDIPEDETFDQTSETPSDWVKSEAEVPCQDKFNISQIKIQGASGKTLATSTLNASKRSVRINSAKWVEDEFGEMNFQISAICTGKIGLNLVSKSNFYKLQTYSRNSRGSNIFLFDSRWFSHAELVKNMWVLSAKLNLDAYFETAIEASDWAPVFQKITPSITLLSSTTSDGSDWNEKGSVNVTYKVTNPEFDPKNRRYYDFLDLGFYSGSFYPENDGNIFECNLSATYSNFVDGVKTISVQIDNTADNMSDVYDLKVDTVGSILSISKSNK